MDDFNETELYEPADMRRYTDEVLTEQEARKQRSAAINLSAQVTIDFLEAGPLSIYLADRREKAIIAIHGLIDADATDAVLIKGLQSVILEYTDAAAFVVETFSRRKEAEAMNEAEHGERLNGSQRH